MDRPLASLSITHVHYDPTDPLSYLSAYLALVPQFLCIVYATLIYTTREVEIILTFAGQLACEALNFALKRLIKEQRPDRIRALGKGYGMPSSHAQFVAFWAIYVSLFLIARHAPSLPVTLSSRAAAETARSAGDDRPTNDDDDDDDDHRAKTPGHTPSELYGNVSPVYALQLHHPRFTHALLAVGTVVLAAWVAASRMYLGYHTMKQVLVGVAVGAAFAVAWFVAVEWARRSGLVEWLLEWRVVRSARVRDLLCEQDLVELGWQVWEEKRRMAGIEPTAASRSTSKAKSKSKSK